MKKYQFVFKNGEIAVVQGTGIELNGNAWLVNMHSELVAAANSDALLYFESSDIPDGEAGREA